MQYGSVTWSDRSKQSPGGDYGGFADGRKVTEKQKKLVSEIIDLFAKEYSWEDMKQACVAIAMVCITKQLRDKGK